MPNRLPAPKLLSVTVALLVATGCGGRLGLDIKEEVDTAVQNDGLGTTDTGFTGSDSGDPNGAGDTGESGGGSTSPAVYRNNDFSVEDWRDVMWRTRKSRRRGL